MTYQFTAPNEKAKHAQSPNEIKACKQVWICRIGNDTKPTELPIRLNQAKNSHGFQASKGSRNLYKAKWFVICHKVMNNCIHYECGSSYWGNQQFEKKKKEGGEKTKKKKKLFFSLTCHARAFELHWGTWGSYQSSGWILWPWTSQDNLEHPITASCKVSPFKRSLLKYARLWMAAILVMHAWPDVWRQDRLWC